MSLSARAPRPRDAAVALTIAAVAVGTHNALRVAQLRRVGPTAGGTRDHRAVVGEGAALRLVVLGDSAADGFGMGDARLAFPYQAATRLAGITGRRVRVDSLACPGATTSDLIAEQVPVLRGAAPDVVVLSVGVNDAVSRHAPRRVGRDTSELVAAVRDAAPDADVVLLACPDLAAAPRVPRPLRDLLGWSCRRVRRAQSRACRAVDVPVAVIDARVTREMFGTDGFHPSAAGQAAMAAVAVDALFPAASLEPAGQRRRGPRRGVREGP